MALYEIFRQRWVNTLSLNNLSWNPVLSYIKICTEFLNFKAY
jgi:hypothetical protein